MAQFEVFEQEGTRWVRVVLEKEAIRAEAGALCTLEGDIRIDAPIPSVLSVIRSSISDETVVRPLYTGTGVLHLESSLGGFYMIDLADETWILERGAYWASEASVEIGIFRERASTSFWAGAGFIDYRTRVKGSGKVVLATRGPVEEVPLKDGRYWAQGAYVIARTSGVSYAIRRPTKSYLRSLMTREQGIRAYEGTGRLLVSTAPYWRLLLAAQRPGAAATASPPDRVS